MNYSLEPLRITRDMILNVVSEEQLMEHYLGVPVKKGLFKSPLRHDTKPTCCFFKGRDGKIIFHDFAGYFSGDFVSVVIFLNNCSYHRALRIIANDFGIIHDDKMSISKPKLVYTGSKLLEKETAKIQVEISDFQQYELDWWKSFGISESTLKKYNVFSCKNIFLNDNLFHLEKKNQKIFGYYGGTNNDNLEYWKCYFADKREKYRFLSNWPGTKLQGAKQLPKDGGDWIVITKSMKDVMLFYELGVCSVAPSSETVFMSEATLNKIKSKFKHIVVFFDNDIPGIHNMRKIKKSFPELVYTWIPRKYEAKDISDFYKKYGKDKTIDLINQAKSYYAEKTIA